MDSVSTFAGSSDPHGDRTLSDPRSEYHDRLEQRRSLHQALSVRDARLSYARLVVFGVFLLLLGLMIELMVTALLPEVSRFGPFTALPTAVAGIPPEDAGLGEVDLLAPELAALAMLAWIGAAFAGGYAMLRRRDVH